MPASMVSWTNRTASRSVLGTPRCHPPRPRIDTVSPDVPNGRRGISAADRGIGATPRGADRMRTPAPQMRVTAASGLRIDSSRARRSLPADDGGFRQQVEIFGNGGRSNCPVAPGEHVANLADRPASINQVEGFVGMYVRQTLRRPGERAHGRGRCGAETVGDGIVVID